MLRLRPEGTFTAGKSIASSFAGLHLGDNNESDGLNTNRKIAVVKMVTIPADAETLVVGTKTFTFKNTVVAVDQIKIGNLVTNGDFAALGEAWINYGNWVITAGLATHTAGTPTLTNSFTQALVQEWFPKPVVGLTYTTGFTITNMTAGSVRIKIGGTLGTVRNTNAGHTEALVAVNDGDLQFIPTADFDGEISAVTVTEPSSDLKGETVLAIANAINNATADAQCTAYQNLGLTTLLALVANVVGATPTLTVDGAKITIDKAWANTIAQAVLEDTDYWKKNITTEGDVKPIILVERTGDATWQSFLY